MRSSLKHILSLLMLCLAVGCEHRPLVDMGNTHYVRVYVDEHLKNVTEGFYDATLPKPTFTLPKVMRLMLCDPDNGRIVGERYLQHSGVDPRGYYLDGYVIAPPGEYNLMLYNFGTETTQLYSDNNFFDIRAYTYEISDMIASRLPQSKVEFDDQPIVYDPDHLFVSTREHIKVPPCSSIDTLYTASGEHFAAQTMVKSYYLQVRVKGIQWVSSSVSLLSGMSRMGRLYNGDLNESEPSILYFEMNAGHRSDILVQPDGQVKQNPHIDLNEPQTAVLYATFNTFGKLPNVTSTFRITFEFVRVDGKSQTETMDITAVFDTKEATESQWLLIDKEIEIEKPDFGGGGGGFDPGVDDWVDEDTDIVI